MELCVCCSKSYNRKKVNQLYCSEKCKRRIQNLRSKDRLCIKCGAVIVGRHRVKLCNKCRPDKYVKRVVIPKIKTKPIVTKTIVLKVKENK